MCAGFKAIRGAWNTFINKVVHIGISLVTMAMVAKLPLIHALCLITNVKVGSNHNLALKGIDH